jgi:putative heme iron utilization protein
LAPYLNKAVVEMLPQTKYNPNAAVHKMHESINDLPVISATTNQLFWPASESRHFTRIDAGKAFKDGLLPADMRIPHPQMVEKHLLETNMSRAARMSEQANLVAVLPKKANNKVKMIGGGNFDLRVEQVNVESTGKTGRSRKGVGHRYGMPHEDRKRGQIKIPTSVE